MIYDILTVNKVVRLRRTRLTRWPYGIFALLFVSKSIHEEVKPFIQNYLSRTTHRVAAATLFHYLKSELVYQSQVQKLEVTLNQNRDQSCRDLLPLILLKKQHPAYEIKFHIAESKFSCSKRDEIPNEMTNLVEILAFPSSAIDAVCSKVEFNWRSSPLPFIRFTPKWYSGRQQNLHEHYHEENDPNLLEYLGIQHLHLNFRLARVCLDQDGQCAWQERLKGISMQDLEHPFFLG